MSAETTLLPVARSARSRPPWLVGVGVLLALAVLIGGSILVASLSGGGRVLAGNPGRPPAAGSGSADSSGSPSGSLPGSPPDAPAESSAMPAASSVAPSAGSAASSGARPSPTPRPSAPASGGTAPTTPGRSPSPTGTGATGAGLTVAFRQSDSWRDGYQARYTITNHGTVPVSGWTVTVTFSGSGGFQWWDADAIIGTKHQIIFTAKSYNSTVPAGGSVTFGLIVTGSPPPTPTACTVNGHSC